MKKMIIGWLALLLALGTPLAQAGPILSINPALAATGVGGTVLMEVRVDGLTAAGEIVSAFDLDILYDSTLLDAANVVFNYAAFGGAGSVLADIDDASGVLKVFLSSELLDSDLAALQGDSVSLFTFEFMGLAAGSDLVKFGLDPDFERAVLGRDLLLLDTTAVGACVVVDLRECANEPNELPEPPTPALALLALLGLALTRRRAS